MGRQYVYLQCITDMPCMTLGESLIAVSYTQQAGLHMQRYAACMSLTEALCLTVSSTGKVGIEMPHRNLLVMERTYISLSLSVQE